MKRWKKHLPLAAAILAAGALLCVPALRRGATGGDLPAPSASAPASSTPAPAPPSVPPDLPPVSAAEGYPRVDGSTATLPLSQAIWAAYTGGAEEDCPLRHNRTHEAYENLIYGLADLILVTEPSADELRLAAALGVELEVVPVVAEGFVFLASGQNPVTSLTRAQIRGIYTGAITSWAEVGGDDLPITAYQRPANSGSQTGMRSVVMEGAELMPPPTELVIESMGGLVDVVADYHNTPGAIGYSYYYYVTDMYRSQSIQLLAVDGVTPTAANIASGAYPFGTAYYAVLRADTPAEHPARDLLAFLLSEPGQAAADRAGYVPLDPVQNPPVVTYPVAPLSSTDTYPVYDLAVEETYRDAGTDRWGNPAEAVDTIVVRGLWDKAAEARVNETIAAALAALPGGAHTVWHEQFAGLLALTFYGEEGSAHLTLDLNTGDLLRVTDLFGSREAAEEALRGAAAQRIVESFGYREDFDLEGAARALRGIFGEIETVRFSVSPYAISFFADTVYEGPDGFLSDSVALPLAACRDFVGYHKYAGPIAPLRANRLVWLSSAPDYRGGRFLAERPREPSPPYSGMTEREQLGYAYYAERVRRAAAETEALYAATPEDTGRYDKLAVSWSPWPIPDGVRLVQLREQTIRFTAPRAEWDAVWQPMLLSWLLRRGYSPEWDSVVTLSEHLEWRALPVPDTLAESYTVTCVDPVTGKEYRRIEDFFAPDYDAKAVVMEEMAAMKALFGREDLEDEALYALLMPMYTAEGFLFYYDSRGALWSHTIPAERFDLTRLTVPQM